MVRKKKENQSNDERRSKGTLIRPQQNAHNAAWHSVWISGRKGKVPFFWSLLITCGNEASYLDLVLIGSSIHLYLNPIWVRCSGVAVRVRCRVV